MHVRFGAEVSLAYPLVRTHWMTGRRACPVSRIADGSKRWSKSQKYACAIACKLSTVLASVHDRGLLPLMP